MNVTGVPRRTRMSGSWRPSASPPGILIEDKMTRRAAPGPVDARPSQYHGDLDPAGSSFAGTGLRFWVTAVSFSTVAMACYAYLMVGLALRHRGPDALANLDRDG